MSERIITGLKSRLPLGDYTVVSRLKDFAGNPYSSAHEAFLDDSLAPMAHKVELSDGLLFVAIETINLAEDAVISAVAWPLYRGLAQLALEAELEAFAIATTQLSPTRPLAESFSYLDEEVSLELNHQIAGLRLQPEDDTILYQELQQLLNH